MNLLLTYLTFLFLLLGKNILTCALNQSIADCRFVASQFNNTCEHGENYDIPAVSVSGMTSETVTCRNKPHCIDPDSSTLLADGTTCTWERKLCVTCFSENGIIKIRVQTNNLPNHCVNTISIKAKNFDYSVNFNSEEEYGQWVKTVRRQNILNNIVCPIRKTFNRDDINLVEYGDDESANVMGISINGVAWQFANQINEDPVYPINQTNEQPLDICLGHNQLNSDSGMYHYHDISPCINPNFLQGKQMSECIANSECNNNIVEWKMSGYEDWKYKKVIGIGKDGHVIYGPYNEDGELWKTDDVDICNGAWSGDNEYFYVGTRWHPYGSGCVGPYNHPQDDGLYPQCSTNGIDQYIDGSSNGGMIESRQQQLTILPM